MQEYPPEQEKAGQKPPSPHLGKEAAPIGGPFTNEEWTILEKTPLQVGRAMMAVAPSGPIGTAKEIFALQTSIRETLQGATTNVLTTLGQQLQGKEMIEALWEEAGYAFLDRWDAANVRATAVKACQQAEALLKKVSPQEAESYKAFVYATAQKVAQASTSGGILGLGGERVSEAERTLLKDVADALELQRA